MGSLSLGAGNYLLVREGEDNDDDEEVDEVEEEGGVREQIGADVIIHEEGSRI